MCAKLKGVICGKKLVVNNYGDASLFEIQRPGKGTENWIMLVINIEIF